MAPIITPHSSWASSKSNGIDFGLIFFSSNEAPGSLRASPAGDMYRLVIESAKYADQHGFSSVWIPERHFTKDGWLYPNPAVLQAALARETSRIHLRAGSVVVPLHNPLRIAEEWAMVDNLSGGRVGVSFASGWHPNDFSLAPDNYADRNEIMYRNIEVVRKLWRGEAVPFKGGDGKMVELKTYPPPLQRDIPFWLTAAGNPKTFAGAGKLGANLLTHMYNQSVDELAEKIRIYRDARAENGYDPTTGKVSVMLHTYVGADMETVRAQIQGPFSEYLKSASYLVNAIAYSRGQKADLSTLSEQDLHDYLIFITDRLISQQRVLFGTPETCAPLATQLQAAGVDEIACQMDFGVDIDLVLSSMPYLNKLREQSNGNNDLAGNAHYVENANLAGNTDLVGTGLAPVREEVAPTNGTGNNVPPTVVRTGAVGQTRGARHTGYNADPVSTMWSIQQRCKEEVSLPTFYQRLSDHGIQLTGSFQSITHLWRGDGEALGEIQLASSLYEDANYYQIHPTLLDSCFQVIIASLPDTLFQQNNVFYLPTSICSFQLHARPGKQVWSHARLDTTTATEGKGPAPSLQGDVHILDEHGNLIAEANGLQLLRSEIGGAQVSSNTYDEINQWLYQLHWEAIQPPTHTSSMQPGHWLIFMDKRGIGQCLAQQLQAQGHTCSLIQPSEHSQIIDQHHYQLNPANPQETKQIVGSALTTIQTLPLHGVIHLWSLDTTPVVATTATSLEADQLLGVQSALSLIQALIEEAVQTRLWLITEGAQPVTALDTDLAVSQSPLWGLGKTCAMEHPELWGGLIDLDPQATETDTASQLMTVLHKDVREDQIALRGTTTYAARMVRAGAKLVPADPLHIEPDAAYLITGGLWGLGLEIARWLAAQGARSLILLGRSKLPPRETWEHVQPESRQGIQIAGIRSIEQLGAQVQIASIDVTNAAELAAFLQRYQQQAKSPIRGIIHAASVWQDAQGQSLVRPLAQLKATDLATVLRPKMLGGWLLSNLFKEMTLDFFVSFSSGASLFGSAGQGNYAAASEFLDVLAHYQRAHGQPAISIDWGTISEIGFGATPEGLHVQEYWEAHGIQRISPKQVLAVLELLIPQDTARMGVLKLDWQLLQQFYPQITDLPLVSQLVQETVAGSVESTGAAQGTIPTIPTHQGNGNTHKGNNVLQALRDADEQKHSAILTGYVQGQVANVLRISTDRLDNEQPLTTLGLDSLMAIELKNHIELDLRIRIPIVTFLQGPSITQFVQQVLVQMEKEGSLVPVAAGRGQALQTSAHAETQVISDIGAGRGINHRIEVSPREEITPKVGTSPAQGPAQSAPPTDIEQQSAAQLLAQLDQLSDQDVDRLLSQMLSEEEKRNNE